MNRTRAAGRTMTAGELREHLSTLADNAPVFVALFNYDQPIVEAEDEQLVTELADDDPFEEGAALLDELNGFTGTKKEMLAKIAAYFGE